MYELQNGKVNHGPRGFDLQLVFYQVNIFKTNIEKCFNQVHVLPIIYIKNFLFIYINMIATYMLLNFKGKFKKKYA